MKKAPIALLLLLVLTSWPRADAARLGSGVMRPTPHRVLAHPHPPPGSMRTMNFVRDNGEEQDPDRLEHERTERTPQR